MHGQRASLGERRTHGNSGRNRGGVIYHDEVAGQEQIGQVCECVLAHVATGGPADEQPHVVPAGTARFGRLVRLELRAQFEGNGHWLDRGRHDDASAVAVVSTTGVSTTGVSATGAGISSAARYRPLGMRSRMSRKKAGTTASGVGRSEMSSPGKASWCIWVRMSPGSTRQTLTAGSSAASTLQACSSPALAAPYPPQPAYASTAASDVTLSTAPPVVRRSGSTS